MTTKELKKEIAELKKRNDELSKQTSRKSYRGPYWWSATNSPCIISDYNTTANGVAGKSK